MTFMSNLVVLTKKDKSHCFAERMYIWPNFLAGDCPARMQTPENLKDRLQKHPMAEFCGGVDKLSVLDVKNSRAGFETWLKANA